MGFCSPKKALLCSLVFVALLWGAFMMSSMGSWRTAGESDNNLSEDGVQPAANVGTINLVPQTEEEKAEEKRGFERNGFNQFVSDRVPLDRTVPDTRDER